MNLKKSLTMIVSALLITSTLASCSGGGFKASKQISVISREEGSGTRGAFIELFGIEQKDESGKKVDKTIETAEINDSTGIVLTNVASNKNAIGYVSLGALNDTVKAVKINGAAPTAENIKNKSYTIARPFNIATKENLSDVAKDFILFILSTEGQKVVSDKGYIAEAQTKPYDGSKPSGKIVVGGSSSVTPLMEKLKEAYYKINPNGIIEVQQSDSTTGMNSTLQGICDIGMASRELKESEVSAGLKPTVIATDGIAVIINKENTAENLTVDQVKGIYTGEFTKWSDVIGG